MDERLFIAGGTLNRTQVPSFADAHGTFLWEGKVRAWNEWALYGPWSVPRQAWVRVHS
jgi:hypothetical protein